MHTFPNYVPHIHMQIGATIKNKTIFGSHPSDISEGDIREVPSGDKTVVT